MLLVIVVTIKTNRPKKKKKKNTTILIALPSKDGYTQICHFLPRSWKGDKTLFDIIMKGRTWLEAYEIHLQTGVSLDRYLQAGGRTPLDGQESSTDFKDLRKRLYTLLGIQIYF